jgi:hypothetical protein
VIDFVLPILSGGIKQKLLKMVPGFWDMKLRLKKTNVKQDACLFQMRENCVCNCWEFLEQESAEHHFCASTAYVSTKL